MFTINNAPIESLEQLNAALTGLHFLDGSDAYELTTDLFYVEGGPRAEEIDQAIATYNQAVYDYFDVDEAVTAIKAELSAIVADPADYTLVVDTGLAAYIKDNGYGLEDQAQKLLVAAANNSGEARHQTASASGNPNGAHAYVHLYGPNLIYGFTDDGYHRGYPKVTVVSSGDVSDGTHRFTA